MREIHNTSDAVKYFAYNWFCERLNNVIKEVALDRLGESWDTLVSLMDTHITFEEYINIWKGKGYKII